MRSNAFTPTSLADALQILATERVVPIAGGTDLMVRHRRRGPLPIRLNAPPLFIGRLRELCTITETHSDLIVGAAVSLNDIAAHRLAPAGLTAAIAEFASPAIRNAGTIGGNICNASPAGDTLPYLYAVGATVVLASRSAERDLPVSEFITGPGRTLLDDDELMTRVVIPRSPVPFFYYRKVAPRRSNALSKLSVYAECEVVADGDSRRVSGFHLAVGAVAPTVIRIPDAEGLVEGATATELRDRAEELLAAYRARIEPIDDQRSTATYRRNTALTLIRHLLEQELPTHLEHP
jgi:CO/xanthine dehydrogenase FAD-binding subunit